MSLTSVQNSIDHYLKTCSSMIRAKQWQEIIDTGKGLLEQAKQQENKKNAALITIQLMHASFRSNNYEQTIEFAKFPHTIQKDIEMSHVNLSILFYEASAHLAISKKICSPSQKKMHRKRAEILSKKVLALANKQGVKSPSDLGKFYLNLAASIANDQDNAESLKKALKIYEKALDFFTKTKFEDRIFDTKLRIAKIQCTLGLFKEAEKFLASPPPRNEYNQMRLVYLQAGLALDRRETTHANDLISKGKSLAEKLNCQSYKIAFANLEPKKPRKLNKTFLVTCGITIAASCTIAYLWNRKK